MLVLVRKVGQEIEIGDQIVVRVLKVKAGHEVSLGIQAPAAVSIVRTEVAERQARQRAASEDQPDTAVAAAGD